MFRKIAIGSDMKGVLNRFRQRQARQSFKRTSLYASALQKLVDASVDSKSYRQGEQKLNTRIKPNEVVVARALDNDRYYRTVMIKANLCTGGFQINDFQPCDG